jgi:hypothetical protein
VPATSARPNELLFSYKASPDLTVPMCVTVSRHTCILIRKAVRIVRYPIECGATSFLHIVSSYRSFDDETLHRRILGDDSLICISFQLLEAYPELSAVLKVREAFPHQDFGESLK